MLVIDDVLDPKEAGKLLKVHPRTVIRLAERGKIPAYKVGELWRFKRSDIEAYLESQKYRPEQKKDG